jgi:hypothetical protein
MIFIEPHQLATWITEREGIWQMQFLNARNLSSHARDRGVSFAEDDVKTLWLLRLLRADRVASEKPGRRAGLLPVARDHEGLFLYADARTTRPRKRGWADSAKSLRSDLKDLELWFHPFRYWVLFSLQRALEFNVMPMQALYTITGYQRLARSFAALFRRTDLASLCERWNQVVALAVASEPCVYPDIFGQIRYSFGQTEQEQKRFIEHHKNDVLDLYRRIPVSNLEKVHEELCVGAYVLDSNRNVYAMLRLAKGQSRLDLRDALVGP